MINMIKNNKKLDYLKHPTKKKVLQKFLLVFLVLILYFIFMSYKYGLGNGFLVTLVTWSFFVFCTPIADAGFLLDFPIRLITKIKMIYSEIIVWIIAFSLNLYAFNFNENIYKKTEILKLFKHILINPWPFWIIIFLSGLGTFLSLYFGDELIDVTKHEHRKKYKAHKNKYFFIFTLTIIVLIIFFYIYLLDLTGMHFKIF